MKRGGDPYKRLDSKFVSTSSKIVRNMLKSNLLVALFVTVLVLTLVQENEVEAAPEPCHGMYKKPEEEKSKKPDDDEDKDKEKSKKDKKKEKIKRLEKFIEDLFDKKKE